VDHALTADVGPSTGDGARSCTCERLAVAPGTQPPQGVQVTHGAAEAAVSAVRKLARTWADDCVLDEDVAEDVVLAVDEAVTNVVEHAYPTRWAWCA